MKKIFVLLPALAVVLALAAPAWAGDYVKRKDKTVEKTKVSGNSGTAIKVMSGLDQAALTSLEFMETSDIPTQIKLKYKQHIGRPGEAVLAR